MITQRQGFVLRGVTFRMVRMGYQLRLWYVDGERVAPEVFWSRFKRVGGRG